MAHRSLWSVLVLFDKVFRDSQACSGLHAASGKSTIGVALEAALLQLNKRSYRLDGDNIRFGLNKDLGFSEADRNENIRRIGEVSKLFNQSCCLVVTAFISPYIKDRDTVRKLHEEAGLSFIEAGLCCQFKGYGVLMCS